MSEQTYSPEVNLFPNYIPLPMSEKLVAILGKELSSPSPLEVLAHGPEEVYHEAYFIMCGGQFYVIELERKGSSCNLVHDTGMLASEWLNDSQHKEIRRKKTLVAKENIEHELGLNKKRVISVGASVHWLLPELFISLVFYLSLMDSEEPAIQNTGS